MKYNFIALLPVYLKYIREVLLTDRAIEIEAAKERLEGAENVVVLTGAGVSAESGVPTFRGADGLWRNFRAEELATPEAFEKDPLLVWQWYEWRREKIGAVEPNPAHHAIKVLGATHPGLTLITQNVDGLHGLAGSKQVLELHGNIWRTRCTICHTVREDRELKIGDTLPYCTLDGCRGLLRPHIVWFGESLPIDVINAAFEAASSADFFFVVGTSSVVQPAASLSVRAKGAGAYVVEINRERTPVSELVDQTILGNAGEIMPEFV